ncbi:MAG: TM2 domain-containing protein [Hyphomicrobiaceae bacterium]|nr:TM2 domain-containing protein [Hyphomicrobiaceae bacterium]
MSMTQPAATFGRRNAAAPAKTYGAPTKPAAVSKEALYAPSNNHGIHYQRSADDTKTALMQVSKEKSMLVAYLLWFFLGGIGAHRFYCGKVASGLVQAGMMVFGVLTMVLIIGLPLVIAAGLWALVDAAFVHRWVRRHNEGQAY